MKLLFAFLIIAAGITSCNQTQSGGDQNADSGSTLIPVEKDVTKCMPHDTADAGTKAFVKYLKYDTTYGLIVGNGTWQTRWRDDINCGFPQTAIPKYEWSSEKVIALRNGCGGNNCSKHVYFIVGTSNVYRRENVFAFDRTNNLIAYFTDNYCMTIENVLTLQKMEYTFNEIPACPSYIACVGKGEFSKGRLTFDIRTVRDNRDQIETKSFAISDNLYKN